MSIIDDAAFIPGSEETSQFLVISKKELCVLGIRATFYIENAGEAGTAMVFGVRVRGIQTSGQSVPNVGELVIKNWPDLEFSKAANTHASASYQASVALTSGGLAVFLNQQKQTLETQFSVIIKHLMTTGGVELEYSKEDLVKYLTESWVSQVQAVIDKQDAEDPTKLHKKAVVMEGDGNENVIKAPFGGELH